MKKRAGQILVRLFYFEPLCAESPDYINLIKRQRLTTSVPCGE